MGSEMCIRDSLQAGDLASLLGRLPLGIIEVGRHGDHGLAHRGSCLLYTSDAADERYSVDLGGRRIIKKKK